MGLKECNIILDNAEGVYYPGQIVRGHVDYTFDSIKKIKGISIKFKGKAEVRWATQESVVRNNRTTRYTVYHYGDEGYFDSLLWLIGGQGKFYYVYNLHNEIELNAGKYSYPFAFQLPIELPSSIEGELGYVRYTIKVTLDRPWKINQETKMDFTVVSLLNLNLMEKARAPINMNISKSFWCWWCNSGPLLVEVNIPVSGYCCGQTIPLDINVENRSNVKIISISVALKKVITYHSLKPRTDSKKISLQIVKLVTEPVLAHSTIVWNKNMKIPPLPPTSLKNSKIIDIDYEIEVSTNSSDCHVDKTVISPIIIGTIPLAGYQTPMPENYAGNALSNQSYNAILHLPSNSTDMNSTFQPTTYLSNPIGDTDPPPPYPYPTAPYPFDAAPSASHTTDGIDCQKVIPNFDEKPAFRESKFGTSDIDDSGDNQYTMVSRHDYFAPRYPTYSFHNQD